ncbi:GTP cyclohydrolase I FolE [Streptomyces sp. NPDC088194]|uniref:GTP cyclohydrolase I FolE n=1 Tax=Streptomyces sp. NPDC088194 TaxID=3154931 RepID=UPI00344B78E5
MAVRDAAEFTSPLPPIDVHAARDAVRRLLAAVGADPANEELQETPRRVAQALQEFLTPRPFLVTTFPNDQGYDELVLAKGIPFRSLCEHHLLPFHGRAHVGYLPGERIVGISKLARVVEHYACRLQVQERLTKQVADWLLENLAPRGVGVVIEAEHTCMTLRGVQSAGSRTITSALHGAPRENAGARAEFFALAGVGQR